MTKADIQKMKDTEIMILTKGEIFWHYSIIPFLLIVPFLTTIDVLKFYVFKTCNYPRPIEDIISTGYIWILPAIAFYFIQKRRLKFQIINISVPKNIFNVTVEQTAKELEWELQKISTNVIIAKSGFSWRSWGEKITIIWDTDRILINSICNPNKRPSVASFGMNKLNRRVFEQFLKQNVLASD